jgi:hypothetical protein
VIIAVPVAASLAQVAVAGAAEPFTNTVQSDAVFGIVQPPEGPLALRLIDPAGNEYSPTFLASNMRYFQSVTISGTQMVYTVQAAAPGVWRARLVGDTVNNGFEFIQAFNSPPPAFGQVTLAAASDPDKRRVTWQLLAAEPDTRVNIYANPGPITQTVTYTGADGQLASSVVERFAGIPLASNLPSTLDGSPQESTLDLAQLPSGTYALWLEATSGAASTDAGARCYIRADGLDCNRQDQPVAPLIIDRRAAFPATWTPALDVVTDIQRGEITLRWPPITHLDVDEYLVRVHTTDPLSPTTTVVREFSAGTGISGRLVATAIGNIEPGQRYTLSVQAKDVDAGLAVWSAPHIVDTPQPDFVLTGPPAPLMLVAGGAPQSVAVTVSLSSELPYPIALAVDEERVADGLYGVVDAGLISVAALAAVEATDATVRLLVSTSSTLDPGAYVLPLVATSGRLRQQLNVPIRVQAASGPAPASSLYLPLIHD